jgi:dynein heavy chain
VGKGWFNLQETRMELYEVSKLKKFMNVVKFMMEDSLRFLVEDSLENYVKLFEISASSQVHVKSTSEVQVIKTLDKKKFPLFVIDLGVIDNKIAFITPLHAYEDKLVSLYKQAISLLQNIPSLEREIMENLIWTHTPLLASVHPMAEPVQLIQKRISAAMQRALLPVQQYLATFETYREFMQLDIEDYIQQFKQHKHKLEDYHQELLFHLKKQEEIEMGYTHIDSQPLTSDRMPYSIATGMFLINCGEVRTFLANKRRNIANAGIHVKHVTSHLSIYINVDD